MSQQISSSQFNRTVADLRRWSGESGHVVFRDSAFTFYGSEPSTRLLLQRYGGSPKASVGRDGDSGAFFFKLETPGIVGEMQAPAATVTTATRPLSNASGIARMSCYRAAPPETCDRCSAGISIVNVVFFKDGTRSTYGSDCIEKVLAGDTSLVRLYRKNFKALERALRADRALAKGADAPRGHEYYGSGIYMVADETGEDVFADRRAYFHPKVDEEKNRSGRNYVQQDYPKFAAEALAAMTRGRASLATEIARLEAFLGRIVAKGFSEPPASEPLPEMPPVRRQARS